MPAIARCPTVPTFRIPPGFGSDVPSESQGEAGRALILNAEKVYRQWAERVEVLNASIGLVIAGADSGTVPYDSVPPNRTFCVKTRYVFLGNGEPMPFELDDE